MFYEPNYWVRESRPEKLSSRTLSVHSVQPFMHREFSRSPGQIPGPLSVCFRGAFSGFFRPITQYERGRLHIEYLSPRFPDAPLLKTARPFVFTILVRFNGAKVLSVAWDGFGLRPTLFVRWLLYLDDAFGRQCALKHRRSCPPTKDIATTVH